jgi:hypothetical protein
MEEAAATEAAVQDVLRRFRPIHPAEVALPPRTEVRALPLG